MISLAKCKVSNSIWRGLRKSAALCASASSRFIPFTKHCHRNRRARCLCRALLDAAPPCSAPKSSTNRRHWRRTELGQRRISCICGGSSQAGSRMGLQSRCFSRRFATLTTTPSSALIEGSISVGGSKKPRTAIAVPKLVATGDACGIQHHNCNQRAHHNLAQMLKTLRR